MYKHCKTISIFLISIFFISCQGADSNGSSSSHSQKVIHSYLSDGTGENFFHYIGPYIGEYEHGVATLSGEIHEEYKWGFVANEYSEVAFDKAIKNVKEYEKKHGRQKNVIYNFYRSGAIKVISPYKDGLTDGVQRWFYEDGRPQLTIEFNLGKEDGYRREYLVDGSIANETIYDMGKILLDTEYAIDGNIYWAFNFDENTRDGLHKFYYESGKTMLEVEVKDGRIDGPVKYYEENGDLIFEEEPKL